MLSLGYGMVLVCFFYLLDSVVVNLRFGVGGGVLWLRTFLVFIASLVWSVVLVDFVV